MSPSRFIARRLAWVCLEVCARWPGPDSLWPGSLYGLGNRLFAYGWRVNGH